jgi:hypothetical protein
VEERLIRKRSSMKVEVRVGFQFVSCSRGFQFVSSSGSGR